MRERERDDRRTGRRSLSLLFSAMEFFCVVRERRGAKWKERRKKEKKERREIGNKRGYERETLREKEEFSLLFPREKSNFHR